MSRHPIQANNDQTYEIFKREALRLTFKHNRPVTMGEILDKIANRLNKKHKYIKI